jgi:hypothetical protein
MDDDPLAERLVEEMGRVTTTRRHGTAHRQCRPSHGVLATPPAALHPTRWVEPGDPPTLCLSTSADGAWAELHKHAPPGVDPAEIRRRIGVVRYALDVVELTPEVCAGIGVAPADLVRDDDLTTCRALAAAARKVGLDGLVSPSAAHPTARTIVVFESGFGGLALVGEDVRSPPPA